MIKIMKINFLSRVDRSKKNQAELDRLMIGKEKLMTMGKGKILTPNPKEIINIVKVSKIEKEEKEVRQLARSGNRVDEKQKMMRKLGLANLELEKGREREKIDD